MYYFCTVPMALTHGQSVYNISCTCARYLSTYTHMHKKDSPIRRLYTRCTRDRNVFYRIKIVHNTHCAYRMDATSIIRVTPSYAARSPVEPTVPERHTFFGVSSRGVLMGVGWRGFSSHVLESPGNCFKPRPDMSIFRRILEIPTHGAHLFTGNGKRVR